MATFVLDFPSSVTPVSTNRTYPLRILLPSKRSFLTVSSHKPFPSICLRRPDYIPNHISDRNNVRIFDTTLRPNAQNPSSKESSLLVCKRDDDDLLKKLEAAKTKANALPDNKPTISALPPSQVMGKVRDFLGIMAESNKKLQQDTMNSNNLDIEALTGDESEYIEMDLMLLI